jgi:hypothetical protein
MSREALFPACTSFGPIFIVIGSVLPPTIVSGPMAFVGAGATSYALITLYKMLSELQQQTNPESPETPASTTQTTVSDS